MHCHAGTAVPSLFDILIAIYAPVQYQKQTASSAGRVKTLKGNGLP